MLYLVFRGDEQLWSSALPFTEAIELVASQINPFHAEQVTVADAVAAGYQLCRE